MLPFPLRFLQMMVDTLPSETLRVENFPKNIVPAAGHRSKGWGNLAASGAFCSSASWAGGNHGYKSVHREGPPDKEERRCHKRLQRPGGCPSVFPPGAKGKEEEQEEQDGGGFLSLDPFIWPPPLSLSRATLFTVSSE